MAKIPSDNSHERHQKPPEDHAGKTADAHAAGKTADTHAASPPGAAEMKSVEATRTNASSGSLQDRRKLIAGQDDSIEISGMGAVASRHSKLTEKDLLAPSAVADAHDKPFIQKLGDFAHALATRALDPAQYKAYIQSEINKGIGIGEGLNTAKEHTKAAAVAAWKALTDGTVANFLAQPNAINDPLCKAIGGSLDAMEKDPNLANHVLAHVEQELLRSNDKYTAMSDREKGGSSASSCLPSSIRKEARKRVS